jgi:hypothetical protein
LTEAGFEQMNIALKARVEDASPRANRGTWDDTRPVP